MPRNFSFWLLLGLVGLFALLLFRIVQPFLIAVFVPAVVGMLFKPLHQWLTRRLRGHERIAAGVTTLLVLLLVLLPISFTLMMAGTQVLRGGQQFVSWFDARSGSGLGDTLEEIEDTTIGSKLTELYVDLPIEHRDRLRQIAAQFAEGATAEIYENTRKIISDVFSLVMSLSVMTLTLYYMLADHDLFVRHLHRILPLQNSEEKELGIQYERSGYLGFGCPVVTGRRTLRGGDWIGGLRFCSDFHVRQFGEGPRDWTSSESASLGFADHGTRGGQADGAVGCLCGADGGSVLFCPADHRSREIHSAERRIGPAKR